MELEWTCELPAAEDAAQELFQKYLDKLNLGIVLALKEDGEDGFTKAVALLGGNTELRVAVVWAKNPNHIKTQIKALEGGDKVNFGPNGHRMVSIQKADEISKCLSLLHSKSLVRVLGAIWCAAREEGTCD